MRFYLLITLVAIVMYFLLKPGNTPSVDPAVTSASQEVLAVRETPSEKTSEAAVAAPKASVEMAPPAPENTEAQARDNMIFMLGKLSECTEIKNSVSDTNPEPTLSTILDSVQSDLGEPVIRSEDWNSTEVQLADGSRRLIRIETVYEDDDIVKKLKYYQVTLEALVPLELTPDQTVNPSETFLASLEKEGEIANRERSERVFFQNGEEVTYIEKNGKILNSEIIRAGKSLKCGEYGQKSFRCQCF